MGRVVETRLLDEAFEALSAMLADGPGLRASRASMADPARGDHDAAWTVEDSSGHAGVLLVEAFSRFTPRSIEGVSGRLSVGKRRRAQEPTMLIVAPWLSPRSRALIADRGWSYLDLTGGTLIRSSRPAVYIRVAGADNDPSPRERSQVLLRGSAINALVRLLVDVEPPYRLVDLAAASGLSRGYVSRALTALHEQGLIERRGHGPVVDVNWPDLLRYRANEYHLLRSNRSTPFQARAGPRTLLANLRDANLRDANLRDANLRDANLRDANLSDANLSDANLSDANLSDTGAVVTGSFAAVDLAPVTAPAQLVLYVSDIRDFARQYDLYPTTTGANVILLQPASPSQLDRPRLVDGVPHVGNSQLVLDLLAGNGRLPEEGEAVLQRMFDISGWRLRELPRHHQ